MTTHAGRLTEPLSIVPTRLVRQALRQLRTRGARLPAHGMHPPLQSDERVLIAEEEAGGVPVVATTFALHHVGQPAGTATWQRLPWEEMGRVHWERRTGVLTMVRFPGGPQRTVRLRLSPSSALPALVRERVAATEIAAAEIALTGYPSTVRARRRPGTTRIVWIVLLGAGVDPHDPQVQAGIDAATAELRTRLGL
jgi:hypothetical protein